MIRNNISNLFYFLNSLLNIDIQDISTRANIYAVSKTSKLKKSDSERFKSQWEKKLERYFPNLKKEVINVSECRWLASYFYLLFAHYYYTRILNILFYKKKNLFIFIYLYFFLKFYDYSSILGYLKSQYIFTRNITKQANMKIYSFKSNLKNKIIYKKNKINLIYLHYERHKRFIPLLIKSQSNLIGLGFHCDLSNEELIKYKLKPIKTFNLKNINSNNYFIKNIKFIIKFLFFLSASYKDLLHNLPIIVALLHYKSFIIF